MKNFFAIACIVMLASCTSNESAKTDSMESGKDSMAAAAPAPRIINSPYPVGYSSSFVTDDPKNAESLLGLWKDWDNGNLSAHKDMFADSVEMHFSDGSVMHASRDSILHSGQSERDKLASAVSTVDAIMAVKATDKNEHWALIWGKEVDTDKKGKKDSAFVQETWRFNNDGKADLMFQYRQDAVPKK